MGKSNELFLEIREEEMALIYRADFTKKHAQAKGVELAEKILEQGLISKEDAFVNLTRLCEVVNTTKDKLKESLPAEKFTHLGVEIAPMNGRKMYNFNECTEWVQKSKELKELEERLKMSSNTTDAIFNSETGEEVQKVSISNAKDSITVKF
jgi:tryptophanyl-tRNA synthetase